MTLEVGKIYIVKHTSGFIRARFLGEHVIPGRAYGTYQQFSSRTKRHYRFENLSTGREITLKSAGKVRREVV